MKSWRYLQTISLRALNSLFKGQVLSLSFLFLLLFCSSSFAQVEQTPPFSYYLVEKELQIISATKEALLYPSVPRYMRVITREQIDRWGAKNLFDLFRHLPEFYVRKSDFYLNSVGALGLRQSYFSEKVQVLIDGIPLADPSNGSSFSTNNNISLDNVKRVEIIYGPMTSLYGFNASLAVVNLITYSPEDVKIKVGSHVSTSGSNDTYLVGSFLRGGFKGIYSFVYREDRSPHRKYTDWTGTTRNISLYSKHFTYYIKLQSAGGFYFKSYGVNRDTSFPLSLTGVIVNGNRSFADRIGYLNQLGFRKEKGDTFFDFSVHLNWFYLKRGYNLCPSSLRICSDVNPGGFYAVEKRYVRNPGFSFLFSHSTEFGKIFGGFDLDVSQLYKTTISANFLPSSILSLNFEEFLLPYQVFLETGNLTSAASYLPNSVYSLGIPYQTLSEEEDIMDEVRRVTLSPYFQYLLTKEDYSFLLNVRLDRATDVGNAFSYSFSVLYRLSEALGLKLNFGRAVRVPSFEEMYVKNNPILLGNKNLKFEKVNSVMPALEYAGDTLQLKLLCYFDWINNLIYKKPVNGFQKRWTNASGTVKVKGMFVTLKKSFFNRYEMYFDIGRRFSYSGGVEKDYFQFPNWKGIAGVAYSDYKKSVDLYTEFYSHVSEEVRGYYLLNFASYWRFRNNSTFFFKVRNILDRNVYYPASWPKLVDEGRNLWVGLEYLF
jgi:iron complex outermembrane receptor protein